MLQTKAKNNYNYSYVNNNGNGNDYKKRDNKNELSKAGVVIFVLTVILVGIILVSYTCQFVQIAHLSYQITSLEDNLHKVKEENHLLNIKLAEQKSMAKIETIARNELQMVEPDQVEIVVLKDKVKQIDTLPKSKQEKVFFVKVFDNFMEKIGTVKAEEID